MRLTVLTIFAAACGPPERPQQNYEPARPYLLATFADGVRAYPPEGGPGRHVVGASCVFGYGLAPLPDGGFLLAGRRLEASKERDVLEFTSRMEFVAVRVTGPDMDAAQNIVRLDDGSLVGVDRYNDRVHLWGPDGAFKKAVEVGDPFDVERLPDGNLVISSQADGDLLVYDAELNSLGKLNQERIVGAGAMLLRSDGTIWVSSWFMPVERLSAEGRALGRIISGIGEAAEMVELPGNEVAVAVNTSINDFVIDVYGSDGQKLRTAARAAPDG